MKLEKITAWLDKTLNVAAFDDVSNNGLQIDRTEDGGQRTEVRCVAYSVDASVQAVEAAAKAGAQLLVVHHGISWGGGIKRVSGGVGRVIRAAIANNLALYACHLPLDAHPTLGNNAQLAKLLGLKRVKPAFNYHGNVIGLIGDCLISRLFDCLSCPKNGFQVTGSGLEVESREALAEIIATQIKQSQIKQSQIKQSQIKQSQIKQSNNQTIKQSNISRVGICSGGAGEFAEEAKRLGCDLYLTGEASWGDVIAAENCGMRMICAGHYETEVWGVRAVAKAMEKALKVKTVDLTETLRSHGKTSA